MSGSDVPGDDRLLLLHVRVGQRVNHLPDDLVAGEAVEAEHDEVQGDAGHLAGVDPVEGERLVVLGVQGLAHHPRLALVLLLRQQLQLDVRVAASHAGVPGRQVVGADDADHQGALGLVVLYGEAERAQVGGERVADWGVLPLARQHPSGLVASSQDVLLLRRGPVLLILQVDLGGLDVDGVQTAAATHRLEPGHGHALQGRLAPWRRNGAGALGLHHLGPAARPAHGHALLEASRAALLQALFDGGGESVLGVAHDAAAVALVSHDGEGGQQHDETRGDPHGDSRRHCNNKGQACR